MLGDRSELGVESVVDFFQAFKKEMSKEIAYNRTYGRGSSSERQMMMGMVHGDLHGPLNDLSFCGASDPKSSIQFGFAP